MKKQNTILITGGTGSVGLGLADYFVSLGERVVIMARRPPHPEDVEEINRQAGELIFHQGNATNKEDIVAALRKYNVDYVLNGAAVTPNDEKEKEDPQIVLKVNVLGLMNTMEAAMEVGVKRFVFLSSYASFGTAVSLGLPLEDGVCPLEPDTMYCISKYAAERVVARYRQIYDFDIVTCRLSDVFGPWEHPSGVRPKNSFPYMLMDCAIHGEKALLSDDFYRDWAYITDTARGVAEILYKEDLKYDLYSIPSGYGYYISEWCKLFREKFPNFEYEIINDFDGANVKMYNRYAATKVATMTTDRLVEETGFVPEYDMRKSFEAYSQWALDHPEYFARYRNG